MRVPSRRPAPLAARARTCATIAAALCLALAPPAATPAGAADRVSGHDRFLTTARVVDARPVYTDVRVREPRLECRAYGTDRRTARVDVYGVRPGDSRRDARGERRERRADGRAGAIVGGLVGGVVGNRLARDGSRGGRAAGTIAGTVFGATIGSSVARDRSDRYGARDDRYREERHRRYAVEYGSAYGGAYGRDHGRFDDRHGYGRDGYGRDGGRADERCTRVVETRTETRVDFYDVTYRFRGRTFHARRVTDPGPTLRIDVSVSPSHR